MKSRLFPDAQAVSGRVLVCDWLFSEFFHGWSMRSRRGAEIQI